MSKTLDLLKSQGKVAAWYDFKAGSLSDKSGNGNTLTPDNAPYWKNGRRGRSLRCGPTVNQRVYVAGNASLQITEGVIIVCLDPIKATFGQQFWMDMAAGAGGRICFYQSSNTVMTVLTGGTNSNSPAADFIGKKFLAVRFKSGFKPQFFLDGSLLGDGSSNFGTITAPTSTLYIGNSQFAGQACNENMTDFVLLNSASVTDQQIVQIYEEMMAERGATNLPKTNLRYNAQPDITQIMTDGPALGTDMDMDLPTKTNWVDFQAVSSKVLGTRTGGTGTRVMQLDFDGSNTSGLTYENIPLTIGKYYRARGWFRGDGTAIPMIGIGSLTFHSGTASASWQYFDAVIKCAGDGYFRLQCNNLSLGHYVQWDEITVVETQELMSDGSMESTGTGKYTAGNSAVITKDTTAPSAGTQNLRIANGGVANPYAIQTVITAGKFYQITGKAKSDGSATPRMGDGSSGVIFNGTLSTSWQPINVIWKAQAGGTSIQLVSLTGVLGQYTEWDEISVKEVKNVIHWDMDTLTPDNKMLDRSGLGNNGTVGFADHDYKSPFDCMTFNGSVSSNVKLTGGLALIASNQQFSFSFWFNPKTLANNPILVSNGNAGNSFYVQITASGAAIIIGGGTRTYTFASPLNHWTHLYFEKTGAGDLGNLYINGVLKSVTSGTLGSTPAFTEDLLLGTWYATTYELTGSMADFRLYTSNLTASERTALYTEGARRLVNRNCLCDAAVTLANVTAGLIPTTNIEVISGTYKISQDASGLNWLECVARGVASFQQPFAYGTFVFDVYQAAQGTNVLNVMFNALLPGISTVSGQSGYEFWMQANGSLALVKDASTTETYQFYSATSYVAAATKYRVAITREVGGKFSVYIKGGIYTSWTLVSAAGGTGTNPSTDNAITTSRRVNFYPAVGDKLRNFYVFSGVIDPTVNPELIPN